MSVSAYWRPVNHEGKRLPFEVKEALRQHPAYINDRAFWCGLWIALGENEAIKEIIDFMDNYPDEEIEVIYK